MDLLLDDTTTDQSGGGGAAPAASAAGDAKAATGSGNGAASDAGAATTRGKAAASAGKGKPDAGNKPETGGKPAQPATKDADAADAAADGAATDADAADESDDDLLELGDDAEAKSPANWPEDWRDKLAGDDEKWKKELGRYASFETYAKSMRALRQKLSSGEYRRTKPPENATPEEIAEWRKENGVPEKPEDYGLPELKGHAWSDGDKVVANSFLGAMHASGAPKEVAHQALAWYAQLQQNAKEQRGQIDRQDTESREDALRAEWGPADYRPNINLARRMLGDAEFISPSLKNALAAARTPDGHRLILHPDLTRFLAERGLEKHGRGGQVTGEQGSRMTSRIEEIRRIRDTDIDRYYADGLDREYLDLSEKMESARR